MIKTKTAIKRENRNLAISEKFTELMAINGSMKSAVVSKIAHDLRVSITTVNRIVKTN